MSFRTLAVSALLVLQFLGSVASPVDIRADDELVKVPGGFLPKSNFHIIPAGGKVVHTPDLVQLFDADGKVLHSSPLTSSRTVFAPRNVSTPLSDRAKRNLLSASVIAFWEAPSLDSFSGSWSVPPLPQVDIGQLLQYFIAVGPPSEDSLLFPVLQYGVSAAGGGPFWSLSTWFITGDQAFATNVTEIAPSGLVEAFITNEDEFFGTATTHAWFADFNPVPLSSQANIQTTEVFNVAFVALEITDATGLQNLPATSTNLQKIALETSDGVFPSSIPWSLSNDAADGITISVVSSAAVDDGGLVIKY